MKDKRIEVENKVIMGILIAVIIFSTLVGIWSTYLRKPIGEIKIYIEPTATITYPNGTTEYYIEDLSLPEGMGKISEEEYLNLYPET